MSQILQPFVI